MNTELVAHFFEATRERHSIYLKRVSGHSGPLTDDPIYQKYRFTNVYRELDRTTAWFRENVRNMYDNTPEVLLATFLFRGFNRIETGKALFEDKGVGEPTGHAWVRGEASDEDLAKHLCAIQNSGKPVVTGAYTIMTPKGLTKSEGVAHYCNFFRKNSGWRQEAEVLASWHGEAPRRSLWEWLRQQPGQGSFLSGQLIADMRFTYLLKDSSDLNLWTAVGPGSARGLHILSERERKNRSLVKKPSDKALVEEMKELLNLSRSETYWPKAGDHPALELSDIQNALCEYSKYYRILNEKGSTRSNWDGVRRPVPGFANYR